MGSGSGHAAQATRPAHRNLFLDWPAQGAATAGSSFGKHAASGAAGLSATVFTDTDHGSDQVNRAISTGRLNASPRLHPRPIDVVVFHGPQGRSRFKGGFPLRCLQRLSRPYIAMLHCRWRDNSSTRGTFIPVLSNLHDLAIAST